MVLLIQLQGGSESSSFQLFVWAHEVTEGSLETLDYSELLVKPHEVDLSRYRGTVEIIITRTCLFVMGGASEVRALTLIYVQLYLEHSLHCRFGLEKLMPTTYRM